MKMYDIAVAIGRFQIAHNGHLSIFTKCAQLADHVVILIGSAYIARNIKNPFTFDERKQMVLDITKDLPATFHIYPIIDNPYSDQEWMSQVQGHVEGVVENLPQLVGLSRLQQTLKERIVLVGHHKDTSSYYLDMFQWRKEEMPAYRAAKGGTLNSTDIRKAFYEKYPEDIVVDNVPVPVLAFLQEFVGTDIYTNLVEEHNFIIKYKKQFASCPYPVIYQTVDACVICNGHILMIKRGAMPGAGLFAMPGGYLNVDEWIDHAIVRELIEETQIAVPVNVLKAAMKSKHTFDAPNRSLRGRTITTAGLFVLHGTVLPKIKGSDDAAHAQWIPINKFYQMSEEIFEDHHAIGMYMIDRAGN